MGDRVQLTERQVEIIVLLAWGESIRCIAKELYLTSATVNYHLGRLRSIFGAANLPALIAAAATTGIITDRLPVQGTGNLTVDRNLLVWDTSVPLWGPAALAGSESADPQKFVPDPAARRPI